MMTGSDGLAWPKSKYTQAVTIEPCNHSYNVGGATYEFNTMKGLAD